MQQLGKIRYRKKRERTPCLDLICAFHPESSDKPPKKLSGLQRQVF